MRRFLSVILAGLGAVTMTMSAAEAQGNGSFGPSNPFYSASSLPFQAPPFDRIRDSDYQPAIEAGMAEQRKEIDAIANDPAAPTFDNTLVAMERSGRLLQRATMVFYGVTQANTNPVLQKVQEVEAPKLAAQSDYIYLNPKLFARVSALYDKRATLGLDPESMRLLEWNYKEFVKAGARLSEADRTKLKKLNEEESVLSTAFTNKLLAATKAAAYATTDRANLAGLSPAQVDAAALAAKGRSRDGYVVRCRTRHSSPISLR